MEDLAHEMVPLNQNPDRELSASTTNFLQEFRDFVSPSIDRLASNSGEMKTLHIRILNSVNNKKSLADLDGLLADNYTLARKVQAKLKSDKALVLAGLAERPTFWDKLADKKIDEKFESHKHELLIKKNLIESESQRFFNAWNEFSSLQATYKDKSKELLVRRCRIANSTLTNEQIEDMLDEGQTDVFNDCILTKTKISRAELGEIQDRRDELIRLEKSIKEVHDLFIDIEALIQSQGETATSIERKIEIAQANVENGTQELGIAATNMKAARKKKLILGIVLVLVLVIIIVTAALNSRSSGDSTTGESSLTPKNTSKVDHHLPGFTSGTTSRPIFEDNNEKPPPVFITPVPIGNDDDEKKPF